MSAPQTNQTQRPQPPVASTTSPLLVGTIARPLVGKVALVTGASRGIGAAIARQFALAGADVAISYSASKNQAEEVVAAIKKAGQRGLAIKADHAVQSEVVALVNAVVKEFGRIDILVNNAGMATFGAVTDEKGQDEEAVKVINRMFAVNVESVATAVRTAAKHIPAGGRIMTIGSGAGSSVFAGGFTDYAASKAALHSYTRGWARDFGKQQVTVNLIEPGPIDTAMNPANGPFAHFSHDSPAGRHGTVDEVAALALFLATPAASYVNAAIIPIDGGKSA